MGTNGLVHQVKTPENDGYRKILATLVISMTFQLGCAKGGVSNEYRESRGEVDQFTVEVSDGAVRMAYFLRLRDDSVIYPYVLYYQFRKGFLGTSTHVEKPQRVFEVYSRRVEAKYRSLHLPRANEIKSYLFLIRTSVLKPGKVEKPLGKRDPADYQQGDWVLYEIPANEVSPDAPIRIPAYKELSERDMTEDQEKLLEDLVLQYDEQLARAYKKAGTPVPPRKYNPLIDFNVKIKDKDDTTEDSKDVEE